MEGELVEADIVVPMHLSFKKTQAYEKYPKGQSRGRWKHLKQILQADPDHHPFYINIESPPSTQPCKRICDVTIRGAICRPQNKPPLCKCSCFQDSKVTLHPPSPPLSLHSQCRSSSQVAPCPVFTCNMYCGRYFYVCNC
ncbi:unnamed protein product [Brassica rapa]|uniref:Uncharacterized protein n=2 Tax=Brassica TaxID=3705 RepID=A0A3P6BCM9_BRACM|nr:unnamed protein product [Brassica napus]CAG7900702.1 unnamed protein product [Brassica rapa]CDY38149.1 BnaA07g02340D [Brassica napus]VDC95590.1 unnamed protein product [Brassica rapa]